MIKKIYIHNYKALVNFTLEIDSFQLFLGDNGTGKSSVFEVFKAIKEILSGENVNSVFTMSDNTLWLDDYKQVFKVWMEIDGDPYEYQLEIDYDSVRNELKILNEKLIWKVNTFFSFEEGEAELYRINRDTKEVESGTSFPADWRRSVISSIAERDDNYPLTRFKNAVSQWTLIHPIPFLASMKATDESPVLSYRAENFAEWYKFISQENSGVVLDLHEALSKALPGFERIALKSHGESRRLDFVFSFGEVKKNIFFHQLSEGERQLVILYTLAVAVKNRLFKYLLLDEPDNFLSLAEVNPFLDILEEACEECSAQILIISHHPEIINSMGHGQEVWFYRKDNTHVQLAEPPADTEFTPAEILARRWYNV